MEAIPAGNACYVRVVADDGSSGVGESTFFGWPTAVAEIVRSFGTYLQGRDPFDVEHHWLALYRALSFRGMAVTGAISAVDQALWDLKGKHFEVPVWQLLGGRARRAVRASIRLTKLTEAMNKTNRPTSPATAIRVTTPA